MPILKNKKHPKRQGDYDPHKDRRWKKATYTKASIENLNAQPAAGQAVKQSAKQAPKKTDETLIRHFPCEQCGAVQAYQPGSKHLVCEYCGHQTLIQDLEVRIQEYNFHAALKQLQGDYADYQQTITKCTNCAAEFAFDEYVHADECPFCGTHIVSTSGGSASGGSASGGSTNGGYWHFRPQSLLPFAISREQAQHFFHKWIKGLWFAPNSIKHAIKDQDKFIGVYLPYWTYDSNTHTEYSGQRGEHYQERQVYYANHNGRRVQQTRYVTKTRWWPAHGYVSRFFDDVLIGATHSLPMRITNNLQPWDLENLVPYTSEYLSGFRSEVYQVALDEGFEVARVVMDNIIRRDICRDIGGDVQRIHRHHTRHSNTTYKHLLLPVWSAAFRSGKKTYRFVVNARSGKVQGERPYSGWKIVGAVLLGALVVAAVFILGGGLEEFGVYL